MAKHDLLALTDQQKIVLLRALNREEKHAEKNLMLARRRGFKVKEGSRDINMETLIVIDSIRERIKERQEA